MRRLSILAVLLLVFLGLAGCVQNVPNDIAAQSLVDQSKAVVALFKARTETPNQLFRAQLDEAQGLLIFPQVVKGAFIFGAEGGDGVMVTRDADGVWGYPAFYTLGGGSLGLQVGGQSSQMILVLRTQRAVEAIVSNQGKFGADLQLTFGTLGAGMEAATTTNLGADVVGFANAAGIFGGVSLEGAGIVRRVDFNQAYYGPDATASGIVIEHRFTNPEADPLRQAIMG